MNKVAKEKGIATISANVFNEAYLPFIASNKLHQHLMGGGGSGKSYVANDKILFRYATAYRSESHWESQKIKALGHREYKRQKALGMIKPNNIRPHSEKIFFIRAEKSQVKKSMLDLAEGAIIKYGLDLYVNNNDHSIKSDWTYDFKGGKNARYRTEIYGAGLRGGGGTDKFKSIDKISGFWIEETTDSGITLEDILQLENRCTRSREIQNPFIICTYNPIHEAHWINQYYWKGLNPKTGERLTDFDLLRLQQNLFKLKTTYKDNRFLSRQYIEGIEAYKDTNPNMYKIYTLGEWGGSQEGCVYTNYERVGDFPTQIKRFTYGIDRGFSDAYAIVKTGCMPIDIYDWETNEFGKKVPVLTVRKGVYVQEIAYARGKPAPTMIEDYGRYIDKDCKLYIGHDGASDKKLWRNAGYSIATGTLDLQGSISFLQSYTIFIVRNSEFPSKNYEAEILNYKYSVHKDTGLYKDTIPKDGNNHLLDATRYATFPHYQNEMLRGAKLEASSSGI